MDKSTISERMAFVEEVHGSRLTARNIMHFQMENCVQAGCHLGTPIIIAKQMQR